MSLEALVRNGTLEAVRAAIESGAPLDAPDGLGFTPLMIACREGEARIARLLIDRGARLDVSTPTGETALGLAMVHCAAIAETLVERGVLGRPLRRPTPGALLAPRDCDVCTRYADVIKPDERRSTPVVLAWLEIVTERSSTEGKLDIVARSLRCPLCGTRYEQRFAYEVETAGVTLPWVSQEILRCGPITDLPTALVGALFVSEDAKLACRIDRGPARGEAPYVATVWAALGGVEHLARAHTAWLPPTKPQSELAMERLGRLQVELGEVGIGNLYTLYVVRKNPDPSSLGSKEWLAALPETPLAELRLFPEHGSSPYVPDDWDWQSGWWYPSSTFRPATPAEQKQHAARG